MAYAPIINPETFGLKPDQEGWVDLQLFLKAMEINREKLDLIMANMDKRRFEISGDKIRAYYGHSFKSKVQKLESQPPDVLYHDTPPFVAFVIKKEGLKPMNRQYVHLSTTPATAQIVIQGRHPNPTILLVDAKKHTRMELNFTTVTRMCG